MPLLLLGRAEMLIVGEGTTPDQATARVLSHPAVAEPTSAACTERWKGRWYVPERQAPPDPQGVEGRVVGRDRAARCTAF